MRRLRAAAVAALLVALPLIAAPGIEPGPPARLAPVQPTGPVVPAEGTARTPVEHFVVLMQSGHTFDNYFGTYPGANGIPPDVCMPLNTQVPAEGCVQPFRLADNPPEQLEHGLDIHRQQYDNGRMNGFVAAHRHRGRDGTSAMGYYDDQELPYYWNVAREFTLFDNYFSSARAGSRANHFYWVAGVPPPGTGASIPPDGYGDIPTIFDRLQAAGVSWKFYVENYHPGATWRTPQARPAQPLKVPLLGFARFVDDPELAGRVVELGEYYRDLENGTLPAVAYVVSLTSSESTPGRVKAGQRLVRRMAGALAQSPYWSSSAFMWTYDAWGGWYDHVPPPQEGLDGYGFRVPALLLSAYSRRGAIDHTQLDHTAVLRFIEDNWGLPALGERDARSPGLMGAFDFAAGPRPPQLLSRERPVARTAPTAVVYLTYGMALLIAVAGLNTVVRGRPRRPEPEPLR
ncbi:alkaline phosphatase family protein [Pseudonocardia hispaniensis]|uniref:Alkaline phosphatase family protein n=1 Tax=Pseudonocardia hispaniensis TaxID=904933 RepID=A0ABW1J202_9PSEU